MFSDLPVTVICFLLVLITLIFAAVLPHSWILTKTISVFDCESAASVKCVWLLLCFTSCGCSSDLSVVFKDLSFMCTSTILLHAHHNNSSLILQRTSGNRFILIYSILCLWLIIINPSPLSVHTVRTHTHTHTHCIHSCLQAGIGSNQWPQRKLSLSWDNGTRVGAACPIWCQRDACTTL